MLHPNRAVARLAGHLDPTKPGNLHMRPVKGSELLSVPRIVKGAWRLVDKEGIEALSTRRLSQHLGVSSAALYHHISNMQELYGLMTEHLLRDAMPPLDDNISWQDWFRTNARKHREAFLSHRDSGRVASLSIPSSRMYSELIPKFVAPMINAGVPERDAMAANGALGGLLLGTVLYEQHEEHRKMAAPLMTMRASFEYGVEAIIGSVSAKLTPEKSGNRNPAASVPGEATGDVIR